MGLFSTDDEDELNAAMEPNAFTAGPAAPMEGQVPEEKPTVDLRAYLLGQKEKRDALESQQSESGMSNGILAALSAVGAGFQGKDSMAAATGALDRQAKMRESALTNFDASTDRAAKQSQLIGGMDATSPESVAMQEQVATLFPNFKGVVAGKSKAQIHEMFPLLTAKIKGDQERDVAKIAAGARAGEHKLAQDEKDQKLTTPFGMANSEEDAKKLKDAYESKSNFDNKINEMIELRKSHKGGALMDREAVSRGKQLSKDLLLEYKNMAKLGVLSAADEKIINAIIPADPLEYNSPVASLQGQDPILNNLQKFKGDSDKDFQTKVSTRVRGGKSAKLANDKVPVQKFVNKKTGATKIVYSDGSSEIKPGSTAGQ